MNLLNSTLINALYLLALLNPVSKFLSRLPSPASVPRRRSRHAGFYSNDSRADKVHM